MDRQHPGAGQAVHRPDQQYACTGEDERDTEDRADTGRADRCRTGKRHVLPGGCQSERTEAGVRDRGRHLCHGRSKPADGAEQYPD